MVLTFTFFYQSILGWIFLGLLIIAHLFLVFQSKSFKKEERQLTKIIYVIAIVALIGKVLEIFIPAVSGASATLDELPLGFTYDLLVSYGIRNVLQILISISLLVFGLKNREDSGVILMIGVILNAVGWTVNYIFTSIRSYYLWFVAWNNPSAYAAFLNIFAPAIFVAYILILAANLVILTYSIRVKQKFLIGYSLIYLLLFLVDFLINFVL